MDNEEIYLDYLFDERSPYEYTPDWLIDTPERHKLLTKKEYVYRPPPLFNMLHKLKILQLGPVYEEYYTRIGKMYKEKPKEIGENSKKMLFVTERIRPQLLLENANNNTNHNKK